MLASLRRSLVVVAVAGGAFVVVAAGCSAPYKAKDGLPVCDDGDEACNGDTNRGTPRRGAQNPTQETNDDTTQPPTIPQDEDELEGDAGASPDAAPAPVAIACEKLATCCDDLKKAGYVDTECRGVVAQNNGTACHATHMLHFNYGDCLKP